MMLGIHFFLKEEVLVEMVRGLTNSTVPAIYNNYDHVCVKWSVHSENLPEKLTEDYIL